MKGLFWIEGSARFALTARVIAAVGEVPGFWTKTREIGFESSRHNACLTWIVADFKLKA